MKIRLLVAYDGTAFRGWQSQQGGGTVQDTLESAIAVIVGERLTIHGSGRTDSGVHGLGQTVHFELTSAQVTRIGRMSDPARWMPALNAALPPWTLPRMVRDGENSLKAFCHNDMPR